MRTHRSRPVVLASLLTLALPLARTAAGAQEPEGRIAAHAAADPTPPRADLPGGPGTLVEGGEVCFVPPGERPDVPFAPGRRVGRDGEAGDGWVSQAPGDPHVLGFAAGEHRPGPEERLDLLLATRLAASPGPADGRPDDRVYGFVMFQGRIDEQRIGALAALGVRELGYHPHNCLRVALPRDRVAQVAELDFVRWVGEARPWQKVHPHLAAQLDAGGEGSLEVWVSLFESDLSGAQVRIPFGAAQTLSPGRIEPAPTSLETDGRLMSNGWMQLALEALGVEIEFYAPRVEAFRARLPRAALEDLLALDFVQFVEPSFTPQLLHDESTPLIHGDLGRASWGGGTSGEVVVGQTDTGMYISHSSLDHFWAVGWDVAGSGTGPWHDGHGHGTKVASTFIGNATADRSLDGMAPGVGAGPARRVFAVKMFDDNGLNPAAVPDVFQRVQSDYADGSGNVTPKPHVVNNSWGSPRSPLTSPFVGTETNAREVDVAVWALGQLHVFGAGNQGDVLDSSITLEGSAKNAFTVGGVLDHHDPAVGLPGVRWPGSSRGPTGDLRWKPNVAAPGQWIRSAVAGTNSATVEVEGTSIATPHVSGLAAQLCDQYPFLRYRAWTLGALMMATALTRNGVLLSAPGTSSTSHHNNYGAGRVEAYRAHNLGGQALYFWGFDMTHSSGHAELDFTVASGATRLTCVMLYHEISGSPGGSVALVNDLDMYLDREPYTPTGNSGDYFSHQSDRDNVETRILSAPQTGNWRVKIYPRHLPPTFLNVARVGVAVVVSYGDPAPNAQLATVLDKDYVRPLEEAQLTALVINPSYVASAVLLETNTGGGQLMGAQTLLKDGHVTNLLPNATGGHSVLLGNIGQLQSRTASWRARWSTEGTKTWRVDLYSENTPWPSSTKTVVVDGTPPVGPSQIGSNFQPGSIHCTPQLQVIWAPATDALSGLEGYSALVDHSPTTAAPQVANLAANATFFGQTLAPAPLPYWFHIRPVDRAGNWGPTLHYGPFTVVPSSPSAYCVGDPNSQGPGGRLSSVGSTSFAANDLGLLATGLPPGQFALFFFGSAQAQAPFGDGTRCIEGQIVRLPILSTGSGSAFQALDVSAPPLAGLVHPGQAWHFQNWYRDPAAGGAGFNLTDAMSITYCD